MEDAGYNPLDLMETKEILEYLARHRFRASVISGVAKENNMTEIKVQTFIKGPKAEVEILQMDINKQVDQHQGEDDLY